MRGRRNKDTNGIFSSYPFSFHGHHTNISLGGRDLDGNAGYETYIRFLYDIDILLYDKGELT